MLGWEKSYVTIFKRRIFDVRIVIFDYLFFSFRSVRLVRAQVWMMFPRRVQR